MGYSLWGHKESRIQLSDLRTDKFPFGVIEKFWK